MGPPSLPTCAHRSPHFPAWLGLRPKRRRPTSATDAERHADHDDEGAIKLSDQQIAAAGIDVGNAQAGVLSRRRSVPGLVTPSGDRIARVAVRLLGTVAELRKRLGDPVEQDEVVAVIESREVADAKSEYLATRVTDELQQTLVRTCDVAVGRARSSPRTITCAPAPVRRMLGSRFDTARQKLFALGLTEEQIAALPQQPVASLRRQELRSPIAGRIAERRVDLVRWSAAKARKANYTSSSTCPKCGSTLRFRQPTCPPSGRGRRSRLPSAQAASGSPARIIFVSPLLDRETRAARVVATLANPDQAFRPGSFVTAEIPLTQRRMPKSWSRKPRCRRSRATALSSCATTKASRPARSPSGAKMTAMSKSLPACLPGKPSPSSNTFTLKAELGKAEAEHED